MTPRGTSQTTDDLWWWWWWWCEKHADKWIENRPRANNRRDP